MQVTPLLSELREGSVVANMEELTRSASEAAADIHKLQNEVRLPVLIWIWACWVRTMIVRSALNKRAPCL